MFACSRGFVCVLIWEKGLVCLVVLDFFYFIFAFFDQWFVVVCPTRSVSIPPPPSKRAEAKESCDATGDQSWDRMIMSTANVLWYCHALILRFQVPTSVTKLKLCKRKKKRSRTRKRKSQKGFFFFLSLFAFSQANHFCPNGKKQPSVLLNVKDAMSTLIYSAQETWRQSRVGSKQVLTVPCGNILVLGTESRHQVSCQLQK